MLSPAIAVLIVCGISSLLAQSPSSLPAQAANGAALQTDIAPSVKEFVNVQAVLLPHNITKELFGKNIADNYVAVFVNIGNRSKSAALVMQGLYLDYSKWALSGAVSKRFNDNQDLESYSSASYPGEVSSIEYRIVRGQLQDNQSKSTRNWVIRGLQFAGAVAASFTFPAGENALDIVKGIAAANGVVIPGVEKLWPDNYITRLNRISDFGYRANRVVPRESSDIVLAFFPIDRFIPPGLKKVFIQSPAAFFNPGLALIEDIPGFEKLFKIASGKDIDTLRSQVPKMMRCHESKRIDRAACDGSAELRTLVSATSLNSIALVVDGSMVIDLATVPALIDSVAFEVGDDPNRFWVTPGTDKAITIRGRYLGGAKSIRIAEAKALGISKIEIDPKESGEEVLKAKLTLDRSIPSGTNLTFTVVKEAKDGRTVEGLSFPTTITYEPTDATITESSFDLTKKILTIKGSNLADTSAFLLLERKEPTQWGETVKNLTSTDGKTLTKDLSSLNLTVGCYTADLFLGGRKLSLPKQFGIPPDAKLTSGKFKGNKVSLVGTDLHDLKKCGHALEYKIISSETGAIAKPVSKPTFSGTSGTFEFAFPADQPTLTFTVELHLTSNGASTKIASQLLTKEQ